MVTVEDRFLLHEVQTEAMIECILELREEQFLQGLTRIQAGLQYIIDLQIPEAMVLTEVLHQAEEVLLLQE